jgi:hypothetical protein
VAVHLLRMFGFLFIVAMTSTACVPSTSPSGARVTASEAPPPSSCKALGDVAGGAGGQFAGAFTDNDAIVAGALNDVRNEAGARGADYVYVGKPQLGVYFGSTRSAAFGGRAYRCAGTTHASASKSAAQMP